MRCSLREFVSRADCATGGQVFHVPPDATLDPASNPTQVVRTGSLAQTQTYTYDASDRLTGVCFQAGTCLGAADPFIRWTYDTVGNRLSEQRPGTSTTSYAYDARDRLLSAGATVTGVRSSTFHQ